jgi:hypothetical protein
VAQPKIYIDGILQTWGDELYGAVRHPARPRKASTGLMLPPRRSSQRRGSSPVGVARVRQMLKGTTKRVPEVVVKISGGGKGMKAIRAHLDYISRNGDVVLENQDGEELSGREDMRYLKSELQHGGFGVPEGSGIREAFNIVFSMPPGTDRAAVHDSVRAFAADEFGSDFRYVFASHTDEAHSHVHLCVMARSNDGTRLNPRKADLQHWRESFAGHLRERGIEANATRRQARGVTKAPVPQAVANMQEKRGVAPRRPHNSMRNESHKRRVEIDRKVLRAYGTIARALAESAEVGDRELAVEIVSLVREMPMAQGKDQSQGPDRSGRPTVRNIDNRLSAKRGREDGPEEPTR